MEKIFKTEFTLQHSQCDLTGQWRPGAILEIMQEAAGQHAEILGVGRNLLIQKGIVWVLSRLEVEMDRYPMAEERIFVETFPMPVRRWFFPRYFIFRDEKGDIIGRAGSLWVLFDIQARKMAAPDAVLHLMPDNSDLLAPLGLPATVREVSGTLETSQVLPHYTDIDVNGHVNNTKYIDWCCNALGIDVMKEYTLQRFAINYDSEVRPGQEVNLELRRLATDFSCCGFVEGKRHFDIGGVLMERVKA